MDIFDIFPRKLKEYRKRGGYTQEQLGLLLEVKPQTVIKYESLDRDKQIFPPGDKLQKMLEIFKCKPSDLLEENEGSFESRIREAVKRKVEDEEFHLFFKDKQGVIDDAESREQLRNIKKPFYDGVPTEYIYDLVFLHNQKRIERTIKEEEERLRHILKLERDPEYAEDYYSNYEHDNMPEKYSDNIPKI